MFIHNTGWVSKSWISSKIIAIRETNILRRLSCCGLRGLITVTLFGAYFLFCNYFCHFIFLLLLMPFECVVSSNNNANTVKLSIYTPMWHQYILLLSEDMDSTTYWCSSSKLSYYFISTMGIYNHQYPLLVSYISIFHGWISNKGLFHCVMLYQTWAKHRKMNSYTRFPSGTNVLP